MGCTKVKECVRECQEMEKAWWPGSLLAIVMGCNNPIWGDRGVVAVLLARAALRRVGPRRLDTREPIGYISVS